LHPMAKPPKSHYTEAEAAEELGLTIEGLRSLIRTHVASSEEDMIHLPTAMFQRSDLLLLRFIASQRPAATTPD